MATLILFQANSKELNHKNKPEPQENIFWCQSEIELLCVAERKGEKNRSLLPLDNSQLAHQRKNKFGKKQIIVIREKLTQKIYDCHQEKKNGGLKYD